MKLTKEALEKSPLKRVGPFRIFSDVLLGKGSFGKVYLASMHSDEKTISLSETFYAAKAIDKIDIDAHKLAKFEEAIISEISIVKSLNHHNIVKLIDVRSTKNRFYLIFEYCSGGTLERYRKSKKEKILTKNTEKSDKFLKDEILKDEIRKDKNLEKILHESESREIVRQIAEAMLFCLNRNIIHRDLKPANILLIEGMVKISDFGLISVIIKNVFSLKKHKFINKFNLFQRFSFIYGSRDL